MIKGIHYTDVHLQATNPPSRLGDYSQDILDKMRRIGSLASEYAVDFTTCGGDLFHRKSPRETPHWLVSETMGVLRSYPSRNFAIPGNHDVQFDRDDTLPEQPLNVLFRSGALTRQVDQVLSDGKGLSVQMHGFSFSEEPDFSSMVLKDPGAADFHILSLHIYASPRGGKLHEMKLHSYGEIASLGYDLVLMGHYHADQGISTLPGPRGDCRIVNIGSLSRGDYGDENLNRVPKCCLISVSRDTSGSVLCDLEEIPVGARPASEVFDLEKKAEIKKHTAQTVEFVAELRKVADDTAVHSGLSTDEAIASLGVSDASVIQTIGDYMEKARVMLEEGRRK